MLCDVRVALATAFLAGLPDDDDALPQQTAEDAQDAAATRSLASRDLDAEAAHQMVGGRAEICRRA